MLARQPAGQPAPDPLQQARPGGRPGQAGHRRRGPLGLGLRGPVMRRAQIGDRVNGHGGQRAHHRLPVAAFGDQRIVAPALEDDRVAGRDMAPAGRHRLDAELPVLIAQPIGNIAAGIRDLLMHLARGEAHAVIVVHRVEIPGREQHIILIGLEIHRFSRVKQPVQLGVDDPPLAGLGRRRQQRAALRQPVFRDQIIGIEKGNEGPFGAPDSGVAHAPQIALVQRHAVPVIQPRLRKPGGAIGRGLVQDDHRLNREPCGPRRGNRRIGGLHGRAADQGLVMGGQNDTEVRTRPIGFLRHVCSPRVAPCGASFTQLPAH